MIRNVGFKLNEMIRYLRLLLIYCIISVISICVLRGLKKTSIFIRRNILHESHRIEVVFYFQNNYVTNYFLTLEDSPL